MITLVAKKSPYKKSPINLINRLNKPILFIYSKEDTYSLPRLGQVLFDKCQSKKRLEWFEHGRHSHVRINAQDKYDLVIQNFIKEVVE